jgi:hypothetical protein
MKKSNIKKQIILIAIFLVSISYAYGFQITEIMFNPQGADTGREWIEIQLNSTDNCINLTEYKLFEEKTNHNIYEYNSEIFCQEAIIVSDVNKFLQDYPEINESIIDNSSNKTNISIYKSTFSLSNTGETIAIKKINDIVDEVNYTLLIENIEVTEGHSLEYYSNYWRSSEFLNGNPGNILDKVLQENNSINTTIININNNTNNITINETFNNTIEESNYTNNITNTTNTTNTEISSIESIENKKSCNAIINIIIKNSSTIYENNIPIKFQNKIEINETIESEEYIIDYWIEDLFGNIIKNKISTNNQDEKSFTPKIDEEDKILVIKNVLKNFSCNISNNTSEKIILIKNSKYTPLTSKSTTCPSCASKTSSSASSETYTCPTYAQYTQNSSPPLIKIINVCNTSKDSKNNNLLQNTTQYLPELSQNSLQSISSNNSSKNLTQNKDKITNMTIYESPNLKNRLYALIGLILVGLTCTSIIVYKIIFRASNNKKIE